MSAGWRTDRGLYSLCLEGNPLCLEIKWSKLKAKQICKDFKALVRFCFPGYTVLMVENAIFFVSINWNSKPKGTTLARFIFDTDFSAVALNYFCRNVKSQP